ncbi:SNF7 family protein [Coniochaeta sp. 2T2.1]|nr:SNF7 family protein [Coniochaeta sp. 2T2.1]
MSTLLDYLLQHEPSFRKARLPALYSDFRSQRTLNPDGYAANISAWRKALAAIARSGLAPASKSSTQPNLLVLDCDERLVRALESKQFGRPLALGAVFAEAQNAKDIIPLPEFLKMQQSVYYKPWTIASPYAVAAWLLRQTGVAGIFGGRGDKIPTGQFVILANLEAAAKEFVSKTADLSSRFERTFSKPQFSKVFGDQLVDGGNTLSATDVDVLLRFLSRDKNLVLYDGKTVKIRAATGDPDASSKGTTISEEDASIAQLKELLSYLTHQTSVLSKRVDELAETAKAAVAKKNRVAALAALKSKKLAESTLAARFNTLSQLEETAGKIQQAADNVALVRVMESSGEALRRLNAAVGGAEGVEGVVDRLRTQMDTADEVNSILADAETAGGVVVDEGEVDDELEAMEAEERAKEEAERKKVEDERRRVEEEKKAAEAEEVRRRLEAAGKVPETEREKEDAKVEAEADDTAEELSRMTLGPDKEAEPQLAA